MALLIRRTDQENHSDLWHSPIALQMSLFDSTTSYELSTRSLSITFRTTFYEQDSLPLRKHVLPVVDKNRNIDTYALNTYVLDTIR